MTNNKNSNLTNKIFDLEERTLIFAKKVIYVCKKLSQNIVNFKLVDQVIRSAGSIGANYREANESLGKKDFIHRLRIARKEAKETSFWLELILEANKENADEINQLITECNQLRNILSAIINKVEDKK
ncbi:MAG: four helix bundle protein [Microgenomates group bacterium]